MNDTVHLSHPAYDPQQAAAVPAGPGAPATMTNGQAVPVNSAPVLEHFKERKARASHQSVHDRDQRDGRNCLAGTDLFTADTDRQQQMQRTGLLEQRRFLENFRDEPGATDRTRLADLAGWNRYAANLALVGGYVAQRAGETKARREQNKGRDSTRSRNSQAVAEMLLRVPAKQGAAHA